MTNNQQQIKTQIKNHALRNIRFQVKITNGVCTEIKVLKKQGLTTYQAVNRIRHEYTNYHDYLSTAQRGKTPEERLEIQKKANQVANDKVLERVVNEALEYQQQSSKQQQQIKELEEKVAQLEALKKAIFGDANPDAESVAEFREVCSDYTLDMMEDYFNS